MNKVYLKAFVTKTAENKYQAVATSDVVDRYGDIVDQGGLDYTSYMLNPIMLWAHDSSQLPVAKCTGIDRTQPGKTIVDFEFNSAAGSPLAPYVKTSYDNGFLNALSIGFMEKERKGNVVTSAELLEISFVPVPANQEALRRAVEKGMDLGEIKSDIEKAVDALSKKGDVADELDEEEAAEQKWEKWEEISEVISALWTVYFDPETDVEDFGDLLTETIALLQEVVANDGADDDDETKAAISKHQARIKEFLGDRTVKAGKTISKKNAKIITAAIEHIKKTIGCMDEHMKGLGEHHTALEDMLNASASSEENGGGKSVDVAPDSLVISKDDLLIIRGQLRANDRQNEVSLSIVNKFLAVKEQK